MITERPLGKTEKLFHKMQEYGSIFCYGSFHGVSRNPWYIDSLRTALDNIVGRSGLLNVAIQQQGSNVNFVRLETKTIPFSVVNDVDDEFENILEKELNRDYVDGDPLWETKLLRYRLKLKQENKLKQGESSMSGDRFSLLFIIHHSIADGTFICQFLESWLKQYETVLSCNSQGKNQYKDDDNSDLIMLEPSLESQNPYRLQMKDYYYFLTKEFAKVIKPTIKLPLKVALNPRDRTTRINRLLLAPELSRRIITESKAQGTTVHGAILSALLFSVASYHARYAGGERKNVRIAANSNVDFRKRVGIPSTKAGCYIAVVNEIFDVSIESEYWALARSVREKIQLSMHRRLHVSTTLIYEVLQRLLPDKFRNDLSRGETQGRIDNIVISNIGQLDLQRSYLNGQIAVDDIVWGGAQHGFGPELMVAVSTFGGQLGITFHYVKPILADAVVGEIIGLFEKCIELSVNGNTKVTLGGFGKEWWLDKRLHP